MSSQYIAWTATKFCSGAESLADCAPQAVYLYDMRGHRISVAGRTVYGTTGAIYHYHVSDRWLVYLDTGVINSPPQLKWRIEVVDLVTHHAYVLAQSTITSGAGEPPDLSLAGSTLVWTSGQMMTGGRIVSNISETDLTTRHTHMLAQTSTPFSFSFPSTDGQHAVWERDDYANGRASSTVMGIDLGTTKAPLRVLSGLMFASEPAVYGDMVIWKSGPGFAPGQILLGSWTNSSIAPRQLTSGRPQADSPVIGDGFVAWATGSTGIIMLHDLHTGRTRTVGVPSASVVYGFPTAAGSMLAYSYMTGVPTRPTGPAPHGFILVQAITATGTSLHDILPLHTHSDVWMSSKLA